VLVASYTEAELEALKLLRHSFGWSVSMDRRSGIWVATYAGERIRQDTPLGLFDALMLAARARRENHLLRGDPEQTGTEPGDGLAYDCCQERLKQLAATIHEANAQILAELEATRRDLAELSTLTGKGLDGKL
jgi:hypothetical protein